jgi:hypothetical protein
MTMKGHLEHFGTSAPCLATTTTTHHYLPSTTTTTTIHHPPSTTIHHRPPKSTATRHHFCPSTDVVWNKTNVYPFEEGGMGKGEVEQLFKKEMKTSRVLL